MTPPVDPLRRVIFATVHGPAEEVAAAYDAITPADLDLLERYCGAIVAAATYAAHTPREVPNG